MYKRLYTILSLVLILVGLLITHQKLDNGVKDGDEICSTNIARGFDYRSFSDLDTVFTNQSLFPQQRTFQEIATLTIKGHSGDSVLYHYTLNKWIDLFGLSDYATRWLSFFFYLIAIFAFYRILKRLGISQLIALFGVAVFTLHPLISDYAVETRSYMMALALTLANTLVFIKIVWDKKYDYSNFLVLGLLGGAMLLSHYLTFYVLLCFGLTGMFNIKNRKGWWLHLAAYLISLSILCIWLFVYDGIKGLEMMNRVATWWVDFVEQTHQYAYPSTPYFILKSLGAMAGTLSGFNLYKIWPNSIYFTMVLAWVIGVCVLFIRNRNQWNSKATWLCFQVLLPILILTYMAFSSGHTLSLSRRYILFALPFFLILLIYLLNLSSLKLKKWGVIIFSTPLLISICTVPLGNTNDNFFMNEASHLYEKVEQKWIEKKGTKDILVFGHVDDAIRFNNYANPKFEIKQKIDRQIGLDKVVLRNQKTMKEKLLFDFAETENREERRYFW